MIVEYIRYCLPDEETCLAFEQAYLAAQTALVQSEHFIALEVARCEEEPMSYIVRIEWDSTRGHLDGFRKSPEFGAFFNLVRPFFERILEMRHYQVKMQWGNRQDH